MKIILPVGKRKAWSLIATPAGIASWFPAQCRGIVKVGEPLEFTWPDGSADHFRVMRMGEQHSSFAMEWRDGASLSYYLHGRRTTLTLEVEYPANSEGRTRQIRELAQWAFRLANLKSVGLRGRDLRQSAWKRSWTFGFID